LWSAVEEKIAEDGRETAGIQRVSRLVHSRWQLAWFELNRALGQIIPKQAGLQGGQHYQYCRYGENSGKITVGKKSLREIQHPGSGSICFRDSHLICSIIAACPYE
jgi:hypothetical protein